MAKEVLSEKVSVNINTSTLSQIDLLVDNGYYSNRSDFINQALRALLDNQQSTLDRIIDQRAEMARQKKEQWFVGIFGLTEKDVEIMRREDGGFTISGYGMLVIDDEVDEDMLFDAVEKIRVKGKVVCSKSIKAHYGVK